MWQILQTEINRLVNKLSKLNKFQIMQEQFLLLKEENFQLKNEISELKNAFDLNRDILKIISEQAKSQNPRIQMLYQIITRLTSINNQTMINTAELIQQKNAHKFEKQRLKRENENLKETIQELLEKESNFTKDIKINQLSLYFKNKIRDMEDEIKSLEQDRIIKEHQIQFLNKKLQYYQGEEKKLSIIPTIDKNQPHKKFIEPPPSTLVPPLQHARKHASNLQNKLKIKLQIANNELRRIKIYCEELEYRLLALIKVLQLQDDVKKKQKESPKKQHRKYLQQQYSHQIAEVRLLKFALKNLIKQEQQEGNEMMFTITNRIQKKTCNDNLNPTKTRAHFLYKSLEKQNKIRMKPHFQPTETEEKQPLQN